MKPLPGLALLAVLASPAAGQVTLQVHGGLADRRLSQPAPAIGFKAGVAVQAYGSPLGTQRWILPRVGADLSFPFTGVPGRAYLSGLALLGPSGTGVIVPTGGVAVRAGAELGSRAVVGFAEYRLERLAFTNGVSREDHQGEILAGLRLHP